MLFKCIVMREMHFNIVFNISIPYPLEILKRIIWSSPLKQNFSVVFCSCKITFYFSQNHVYLVLWYDVKSATLDSLICPWFGYGGGNDSTVRENTTAS